MSPLDAAGLALQLVQIASDAISKRATPEQTARALVLQALEVGDVEDLRRFLDEAARDRAEAAANAAEQLKFPSG